MTINRDSTFLYYYSVGGCQAKITGRWRIKDKLLKLSNDYVFTTDYAPSLDSTIQINDTLTINIPVAGYPDLSKVNWKIGKNYLKPLGIIDTGCLKEKWKHVKIQNSE